MTADEYLKCIKRINPLAHVVVWGAGKDMTVAWDENHKGVKPTLAECEAILSQVQAQITDERIAIENAEKAKIEAQVKEAVLSLQKKGELTLTEVEGGGKMGFYKSYETGEYYEGDKVDYRDKELAIQRPSPLHILDENGDWVLNAAEYAKQQKQMLIKLIQDVLDVEARKHEDFDDFPSALKWVGCPDVDMNKYATALRDWGAQVWRFAKDEWAKQEAGNPTYTTVEEFLAAMPTFQV